MKARSIIVALPLLAGCFYPAQTPPPAAQRTSATLNVPYDLAWNAVHTVVVQNGGHIVTENPDAGAIEFQSIGGFTLADADCGKLRGIGGKIDAEPDPNSSAVYDVKVEAKAPRVSVVTVQATFDAPLHVPLHPVGDVQCVSRGVQEAKLLDQIKAQALIEHRPGNAPFNSGIRKEEP
jgi:hypothetical protein